MTVKYICTWVLLFISQQIRPETRQHRFFNHSRFTIPWDFDQWALNLVLLLPHQWTTNRVTPSEIAPRASVWGRSILDEEWSHRAPPQNRWRGPRIQAKLAVWLDEKARKRRMKAADKSFDRVSKELSALGLDLGEEYQGPERSAREVGLPAMMLQY